jgi:hypothetical protein
MVHWGVRCSTDSAEHSHRRKQDKRIGAYRVERSAIGSWRGSGNHDMDPGFNQVGATGIQSLIDYYLHVDQCADSMCEDIAWRFFVQQAKILSGRL